MGLRMPSWPIPASGALPCPHPLPYSAPAVPQLPGPPPAAPSSQERAPSPPPCSPAASGGGQRVITSRRDGYRERAARHLYSRYASRVYPGKMVPMLYAVGTVEVTLSPSGRVLGTHWLRRPTHAPEVVATIDQLIASASPFPAPGGTGTTRYVDTWLWDESGRFQLDTLTEGQRDTY